MKKKPRIQSPSTSRQMSILQRVFLAAWIIGIVGASVLIVKYYPGSFEKTEQISCTKYCKTQFRTDGYLKKIYENLPAGRGREYGGPWECICQNE